MSDKKTLSRKQIIENIDPSEKFTVRVHSYVFADLLYVSNSESVNFKLAAIYATLLKNRTYKESYRAYKNQKNGKLCNGYTLLSKKSGLSIGTLKKYVPELINRNLCFFTEKGSFILRGKSYLQREKTNYLTNKHGENYKGSSKFKLIPIKVGTLKQTVLSCKFVVLDSHFKKQMRLASIKDKLRDVESRIKSKSGMVSKQDLALRARCRKKEISSSNNVNYPVLSLHGFCDKLHGKAIVDRNSSINRGSYNKRMLKEALLIESRRRYRALSSKSMSYAEFRAQKRIYAYNGFTNIVYRDGYMLQEICSEINLLKNEVIFDGESREFKLIPPTPKFSPITISNNTIYNNI
jgi:hypothetical protein